MKNKITLYQLIIIILLIFLITCSKESPTKPKNPQLSVNPMSCTFTKNANVDTLIISNSGEGELSWKITDKPNWIEVSKSSGTITNDTDSLIITADISQPARASSGTINIDSNGGNQIVTVSLYISVWLRIKYITFPPERAYHDMAYDSESDRVILIGGMSSPGAPKMSPNMWAYDHNTITWTSLNLPNQQPVGNSIVYDKKLDRIIMFGEVPYKNDQSDLWAFDFNSNNWTQLRPTQSPRLRFGHGMVYDVESDRIILFGGFFVGASTPLADTWSYDYNNNTWTEMKPSINPPARLYHSMAYDAESDRVILFGGGYAEGVSSYTKQYGDTWVYDFNSNTWNEMKPDVHPTPRVYTDITYDEQWDRIILFGGGTQSFEEENPSALGHGNETWQYDFNSNTWSEIIMERPPSFRKKHKLVYDIESDRVIMFGGDAWDEQGNTICYQNELWILEK